MTTIDPYAGREQTKAKHFILKHYLQALAFKVLRFSDITYIDGFSGPWETKTENFRDSSFMIAIQVLRDAQQRIGEQIGKKPRVRCFFSETGTDAFAQLQSAVTPFHLPQEGFEIKTYHGRFEDAVSEIQSFRGSSFPLIFIDPTGWTGYPLDKIKPLFAPAKCEVLINFMYEFVNRFANSDDTETVASLNPILGGSGWRERLNLALPRGTAVEELFRETLKSVGGFKYVVSTKIDKATAERPHFYITYATKDPAGLKAFRQTEYEALRMHAKSRANAREKKREERSNTGELFPGHEAEVEAATIDEVVDSEKALASAELLQSISLHGPLTFSDVVVKLLQVFILRETNIRDICVDLAGTKKIENTWGGRNRKPKDDDIIKLNTHIGPGELEESKGQPR